MDFERTTDNALKSMGIGVDAKLKDLGCKFMRTQHGEPIFVKGEDPQSTVSVRPVNWTAEQLRAMADYLDAHPETTKCIETINDDSPTWNAIGSGLVAPSPMWVESLSPSNRPLDDMEMPDMGMPLPPSKFGNL